MALTLATTPASAASPCTWRMDLPINPVGNYGETIDQKLPLEEQSVEKIMEDFSIKKSIDFSSS